VSALHAALVLWAAGFALALAFFAVLRLHVVRTEERDPPTPREALWVVGFCLLASALWFLIVAGAAVGKAREWLMFRRYERWLDTPEGRASRAERFGRP